MPNPLFLAGLLIASILNDKYFLDLTAAILTIFLISYQFFPFYVGVEKGGDSFPQ